MHQISEMSDKFWSFKKCKKINSRHFEVSKNKKVTQQGTYLALENASKWCDREFGVTTIKTPGRWNKIDNMYKESKAGKEIKELFRKPDKNDLKSNIKDIHIQLLINKDVKYYILKSILFLVIVVF